MANVKVVKTIFWDYLTIWVIVGVVVGVLLGFLFKETGATNPTFVDMVKTPGDLWISALKCTLVPLIFSSMISSVVQLRAIVNGHKIGRVTFVYYLSTTVVAAVLAVIVSLIFIVPAVKQINDAELVKLPESVVSGGTSKVSAYDSFSESCGHDSEVWCKIRKTLGNIVPSNIVDAMANSQLLGVMSFSVVVGLYIDVKEGSKSPIVELCNEILEVMIKMIYALIAFTPFAVWSRLCWIVINYDMSKLAEYIGWLLTAGFVSQFLQAFVVYPTIYAVCTRRNPLTFLNNILPAMTTAFATASSAATFPWTLQCAVERNGVPKKIATFVLPLGVTINMDGTCMTLIVSVFWLAYAQGLTIDFGKIILMVITAAISSIGTAPIPSASLMYTGMIAEVADVPLGNLFAIIVAVDWLRDRVRTTVNIMGDSFGAGILAHNFPVNDGDEDEVEAAAKGNVEAE